MTKMLMSLTQMMFFAQRGVNLDVSLCTKNFLSTSSLLCAIYAFDKKETECLYPFDILSGVFFDGFDLNVYRYHDDIIRL